MSYFIDERTIEEIKERADIVDVISSYVELKKTGTNYRGLCPFHSEKTPSFTVSPQKKIYKCFGCGAGGNVITFVMKIDGLTFPDACEKLANMYGIEIKRVGNFDEERHNREKEMYSMTRDVAIHYMKNLNKSQRAYSYLRNRGITNETIKRFGLGYSMDSWDRVVNFLKDKNYDLDLAYEIGLIGKNKNGKFYDYYKDRVIFPIIDTKSRVLGFGARTIKNEMPKYINTSDSPIYLKGKNLYGLNMINKNEAQRIILVEGYMDVISLVSGGIDGVVASLGTALTVDQAKILKNYTENLYISYDGDAAGIKATLRALEIVHSLDWDAKVISLKDGMDPDNYMRSEGKFKYEVEIDRAISGYNYLIKEYMKTLDMDDVDDQAKLIMYIGNIIKKIKSPIKRELQIKKLSDEFNISVETLKSEIFASDKKAVKPANYKRQKNEKSYSFKDRAIIEILKIILNDRDLVEYVKSELSYENIENDELREVYISIIENIKENENFDKNALLLYLKNNQIIDEYLFEELMKNSKKFTEVDKNSVIDELIDRIKITDEKLLKVQILKKIDYLENTENKNDEVKSEIRELLSELMAINKKSSI